MCAIKYDTRLYINAMTHNENTTSVVVFTSQKSFSNSFQIERSTIVVTVFLLIMNRTGFRLPNN